MVGEVERASSLIAWEGVGGEAELDFLGGVGCLGESFGDDGLEGGEGEGGAEGEGEGGGDGEEGEGFAGGEEVFDAVAEAGGGGHGDGEGRGLGGGLGEVAEGVGVGFGVEAGGEDVLVAGEFALGEEVFAEEPGEGVEPVEEAGEAGGEGGVEVAAGVVAEFVEEDAVEGFGGPGEGDLWEVDGGFEESGGDG